MTVKNKVQLITYPDSLGGNLQALNRLLLAHFSGIFPGGVHLLPPFPSTGDRGFAPRTYFEIDSDFGTWENVRQIGANFDLVVDLMVNHISRHSTYFQDFARRGRASPYADLFITLDKIWPGGIADPEDIKKIFLRRPDHPFLDITITETGEIEQVWATFGGRDWSEQIDLDVRSPLARQLLSDILAHFSLNGIKMVRLDAVAYVTKKRGTSCFFVEPEIYEFLDWIRQTAHGVGIELLLEVHAPQEIQNRLVQRGFWVYNFVLPMLVLHTLMQRSSLALRDHLQVCSRRQFTTLDSHDGIPVQPDLDGILEIGAAQAVVQTLVERGANLSRILSPEHLREPDFDAHQVNCTYFSALGADSRAYLAARAIQFFAPGVPQVYYVGLLAGQNAPQEVELAGDHRAINRHNFTPTEVEQALAQPVVQRLLQLIRFRNEHPAFDGDFQILDTREAQLGLSWSHDQHRCTLEIDLETTQAVIRYTDEDGKTHRYLP